MLAAARLLAAAGLAVDSYVHFDLAGTYSEAGGAISEGLLFRAEAVVALLAAIFIVVTGRRAAYLAGLVIAASALAAILVARYVDLGPIGPLPDMYDPVWFGEKLLAASGEAVALFAAAAGIALMSSRRAPIATAGDEASDGAERSAHRERNNWRERTKTREGRKS
jgi:hypothetical protein